MSKLLLKWGHLSNQDTLICPIIETFHFISYYYYYYLQNSEIPSLPGTPPVVNKLQKLNKTVSTATSNKRTHLSPVEQPDTKSQLVIVLLTRAWAESYSNHLVCLSVNTCHVISEHTAFLYEAMQQWKEHLLFCK